MFVEERYIYIYELRLISNMVCSNVESIKEGITETCLSKIPYDHFVQDHGGHFPWKESQYFCRRRFRRLSAYSSIGTNVCGWSRRMEWVLKTQTDPNRTIASIALNRSSAPCSFSVCEGKVESSFSVRTHRVLLSAICIGMLSKRFVKQNGNKLKIKC